MFKVRFIVSKSELNNLQIRRKKLKNTNPLELHFPYMTILKALKHRYCHKYVVQFTDPTPTIYWYDKRAKLTFLNMPILKTI